MQRHLFLYGTLQRETDTPMARWLTPKLRRARRASLAGRLIAVASRGGYYPALLTASEHRRVHGTLVQAKLSPRDWRMLDRYEGAEYRRERAWVRVSCGLVRADVYRWASARPPGAVPIWHGDFPRWLAERGASPYRGS